MLTTASAVEIQVLTGTIISDPFFKLSDLTAISNASVPLPTAIQYLLLVNFEKLFSKFFTSFPPTKFELLINSSILFSSFFCKIIWK